MMSGFTMPADQPHMPVWSPDGRRIMYNSEFGPTNLSDFNLMRATGQSEPFSLGLAPRTVGTISWSPEERLIAFHMRNATTQLDIWYVQINATADTVTMDGTPVLFYQSPETEVVPAISPNGRFI